MRVKNPRGSRPVTSLHARVAGITPGGSVTAGVAALPDSGVVPAGAWAVPQPHISAIAAAVMIARAQACARPRGLVFLAFGYAVPPGSRRPREIVDG
jgi:hypothetical protein